MPQDYAATNDAARERLRALLGRLTDADLARPMPDGWTPAAHLAHAAFWDVRVTWLLDKWQGGEPFTADDEEPENVDWINDSAKPLCLALPPRVAADLALSLAESTDARVAAALPTLVADQAALDFINPDRAGHRQEHIDEIERFLAG